MISKAYTGEMLRGRKALCLKDIANMGGHGTCAGSVVKIVNVVRGKGITIKTEKCPYCGQYAYITRVARQDLELLELEEKK